MIHRIDPRVKVVSVLALAIASSFADGLGIPLLTLYVVLVHGLARASLARLVSALRPLLILVALVVVVRTATAAGRPPSLQGLAEGLRFGWRLLLMAAVATLFLSTTKLTAVKAALAGLLDKVPGAPAGRIALMVGMTLGSLPELTDRIEEIRSARLARLVELRRDPFSRIQSLVLPLGRRLLSRADETAFAMEARCYVHERRPAPCAPAPRDWAALATGLLVSVATVLL